MKKTESNPGYDNLLDDPRAPLSVKIWTNEREYNEGDKIKIYLKGNKPFFARVIYKDVSGNLIQLLPNCYRTENYFNGGTIYEIPSGCDKFELDVTPPFGRENIIVYASTKPLGNIDKKDIGGIYTLNNSLNDVSGRSRGVVIRPTGDRTENTAEFIEVNTEIATR
jgi:hypothetical protein